MSSNTQPDNPKFIRIRAAGPEDVDDMYAIEHESLGLWKKEFFLNEFKNSFSIMLVAEADAGVIGFAVAWKVSGEIQLNHFAVMPSYRRQGAGTMLIRHIIDICVPLGFKKMILEVSHKNEHALSFYRKAGFRETGCRPNFYKDSNAILMEREI